MLGWLQTLSAQVCFMVSGQCPDTISKVRIVELENETLIGEADVNEGYFAFVGVSPLHTVLKVGEGQHFVRFFADSIPVGVDLEKHRITGSSLNNLTDECGVRLDSVRTLFNAYINALHQEWVTADCERRKEIEPEVKYLKALRENNCAKVLKDYVGTMVPALFLPDLYRNMALDSLDAFMTGESPYSQHALLGGVRKYYSEQLKKRPGKMYADLALSNIEGEAHQLSEWCGKGHYVLINFWASWCAPCRKEMPVVLESYVKYQRMGYEVIGVSLDVDQNSWKTTVSNLGMDWTQLSDLKGWKSHAVSEYGISAIPSNILLNGEGVIVAADLRGNELLGKLKEIFGY